MGKRKQYIHAFRTESDYRKEREYAYDEPWLSITKNADDEVVSFRGVSDGLEAVYDYAGYSNDSYAYVQEGAIYEREIAGVDVLDVHGEAADIITAFTTTLGELFEGRSDSYVWHYDGDTVSGTVESVTISGQSSPDTVCVVDGVEFFLFDIFYAGEFYVYVWLNDSLAPVYKMFRTGAMLSVGDVVEEIYEGGELVSYALPKELVVGNTVKVFDGIFPDKGAIEAFFEGRGFHVGDSDRHGNVSVAEILEIAPGKVLNRVGYNKSGEEKDFVPLTFEVTGAGEIGTGTLNEPLKVRINGGEWVEYGGEDTISVVPGDSVQFCGTDEDQAVTFGERTTCTFMLSGNVMSVKYGMGAWQVKSLNETKTHHFAHMFENCTGLTNVSETLLPATAIGPYCYDSMFKGCTNLVNAPTLPAREAQEYCYSNMFSGCERLTFDNTTRYNCLAAMRRAAEGCCYAMFENCTSMTQAPPLYPSYGAGNCYGKMFKGCTNLANIMCGLEYPYASYTTDWVDGVAANGFFFYLFKIPASRWSRGTSGAPVNWRLAGFAPPPDI